MSAGKDRVTEIRIRGMRSIEDITLKLDGLTVLIGENGSGKSTIVEACELLARIGSNEFQKVFFQAHGGLGALLRDGAPALILEVGVELDGQHFAYAIVISQEGPNVVITSESLEGKGVSGATRKLITRNRAGAQVSDQQQNMIDMRGLSLWDVALSHPFAVGTSAEVQRVVEVLRRIDTHLPFDVRAAWSRQNRSGLRSSVTVEPTESLQRFGTNLPNALFALTQRKDWLATLDLIRLGLGDQVENVFFPLDMAGGQLSFALRMVDESEIRAIAMSDGQLAYLAFVALYRLGNARSLLVFDEPELHLHPRLLYRVINMFENVAETHPVLIATHSNELLDMLENPAEATVLLELDEKRTTRQRRVDAEALSAWRTDYRGLGAVRSAGHENSVFEE